MPRISQTPSRSDRIKLAIAVPIIALCAIWIGYLAISGIDWSGPVAPPDTPAHRTATEVTQKLLERDAFSDASLIVVSENPAKYQAVGAVRSEADLDKLRAYIQEIQPGIDFEMNVAVLQH